MKQEYVQLFHDCFSTLVEKHNLDKIEEVTENQTFFVFYNATNFRIEIDEYRQEFYVALYKINDRDNGVELFNLLAYLFQDDVHVPQSQYFHSKKNLEECYRKQFEYNSDILAKYFDVIDDFFSRQDLELELGRVSDFVIKRNPDLFKTL